MRENATLNDPVRCSGSRETFGVSQATINAWCDDGLDYIRIGRERCFFVDELLAFLSEDRRGRARLALRAPHEKTLDTWSRTW